MVENKNEMAEIMSSVISALSAKNDVSDILGRLVSKIADVSKSDIVVLYPYAGTLKEGRFEDPISYGQRTRNTYPPPRIDGLTRRVIEHPEKLMEVTINASEASIDEQPPSENADVPNQFTKEEGIKTFCAVRLQLGNEVKGVCYVNRKRSDRFTPQEKDIIQFIADLSALAIEFARESIWSTLGERVKRISEGIRTHTNQESLLSSIVEQACGLINAQAGCIWLYDNTHEKFTRAAAFGEAKGLPYQIPARRTITKLVLDEQADRYIPDVLKERRYFAQEEAHIGRLRSMLVAELKIHGEVEGAFNIYSVDKPHIFGKWHESILDAFSSFSSIAIQIHRNLLSRIRTREEIIDILRTLHKIRDVDAVMQFIVDQARKLTGADCAYLVPYNPATKSFFRGKVSAVDGELRIAFERRRPREGGLSRRIMESHEKVLIPDTAVQDVNPDTQEQGIKSLAGFPLKQADQPVGVLFVDFKRVVDFAEPEMSAKIESVDLLSSVAAVAIENAALYNQIQRQSLECNVALALTPEVQDEESSKWRGFIQVEGARSNTGFFEIDWNDTNWEERFAERADGLWDLVLAGMQWEDHAKELGHDVYRTFMNETRAEVSHMLRSAFDSQETRLSWIITSALMPFPFEFACEKDFWVVNYPMSRYLADVGRSHSGSFDQFLTQLVLGYSLDRRLKVLIVSTGKDVPQTYKEAKAVEDVMKKTLGELVEVEHLAGAMATIDRLEEELTREYDVFHFAGHSTLDEEQPGNSPLSLHNGSLDASTFAQLIRRAGIKFVYLSSCRSGATNPRIVRPYNFINLADAVIRAGVSAVLAFRWEIVDDNAVLMAERFYQSLFSVWLHTSRPLELAVALRDARLQVRAHIRRHNLPDDGCWLSPILITQY